MFLEIEASDTISRNLKAREIFETVYHIHDHSQYDPKDPLPLVTIKDKRAKDWNKRVSIKRFMRGGVHEKTGLNINQFLYDTSMEDFDIIMQEAEDLAREENQRLEALQSQHKEAVDDAVNAVTK